MAACDTELSSLPLLTGCPSSGEYFLVGNAIGGGGAGLYGRRQWSDMVNCIFKQITPFNGSQLNGSNQFLNSAWSGLKLIVYYNATGLLTYNQASPTYPSSEYIPVAGGGIQILIPATFTNQDLFLVTPNGV